jgi:hypothetical protein
MKPSNELAVAGLRLSAGCVVQAGERHGGHDSWVRNSMMLVAPPNDWRISCGPSCPHPHNPTLIALLETLTVHGGDKGV